MRKILVSSLLLLSLLFVSTATAAPSKPYPSVECSNMIKKAGYKEGIFSKKVTAALVSSGCISRDPHSLTKEETENWDTVVCEELVPSINSGVKAVNYAVAEKKMSKVYRQVSRSVRLKYKARKGALNRKLNAALKASFAEQESRNPDKANVKRLVRKTKVLSKSYTKLERTIYRKIDSNPRVVAVDKAFRNKIARIYYATLVAFTEGCLKDPSLNRIISYNSNEDLLYSFQEEYGQVSIFPTEFKSYINTAYKALKADSVDTGRFQFTAKQAIQAIRSSEGDNFAKMFAVGGFEEVEAADSLGKFFVSSSKNNRRICFGVAYEENDEIKYLSGAVTSKGIIWYNSPGCAN